MFCENCGKQIPDGSKFCIYCGAPVNQDTGTAGGGASGSNFGEQGYNAAPESAPNTSGDFSGGQGSGGNQDFGKKYLTKPNMEFFAAVCSAICVPLILLRFALGILRNMFHNLPVVGRFLGGLFLALTSVVNVASIVMCLLALVAIGVLVSKYHEQGTGIYLAIAGNVLALLGCIGIISRHGGARMLGILALPALFIGIVLIARVLLRKCGLGGDVNIGEDLGAYKPFFEKAKQQRKAEESARAQQTAGAPQQAAGMPVSGTGSGFDGGGLELFGISILYTLLTMVTCSFGMPWMLCRMSKWRIEHTIIDGRRLKFTGTGGKAFGLWIKWMLLNLITCGIYSAWGYVSYLKFEMKHTFYADSYNGTDEICDASLFDGPGIEFFGYSILIGLIGSVTCYLAMPWCIAMLAKWDSSHSVVQGDRLTFDGEGMQFFGSYILILLLTAVTCGIYSPWATVKINHWVCAHRHVLRGPNQNYQNFQNGQNYTFV